ncbi:hypothetical protein D3C85_1784070 [compost metagenome]
MVVIAAVGAPEGIDNPGAATNAWLYKWYSKYSNASAKFNTSFTAPGVDCP